MFGLMAGMLTLLVANTLYESKAGFIRWAFFVVLIALYIV